MVFSIPERFVRRGRREILFQKSSLQESLEYKDFEMDSFLSVKRLLVALRHKQPCDSRVKNRGFSRCATVFLL